jgi:hypothetical protein
LVFANWDEEQLKLNTIHPVVFYNAEVFISVYKHNSNLSSVNDNLSLVNHMATCFGCDYSHHQANV